MVSTYTSNKANLEKPAAGDDPNTWWQPMNENFDAIDKAIGGTTTVAVGGSNITLTSSQAQASRIRLTGTATTPLSVMFPSTVGGLWVIQNDSNGSAVTIKTTAVGSVGVIPAQTLATLVFSDGTNVVLADQGTVTGYVPIAGGSMTGALALPSNGLAVGGTQLLVSSGNVSCSGSFTAGGDITAFSDRRHKKQIETIRDALAMVRRMRGVRYRRRGDGVESVGLIAQEVQEVIPEVVHEMSSGMLAVAYGNLVGVLVEAIKELTARVEKLETRR